MAVPTIDEINEYNPWLKEEKFEVPQTKREIYEEVKKTVEKRNFIVALVGPRRVGKTILMKQVGNEVEGEKFFFSFDEEAYQNVEALKFVISYFLRISKSKPLIFLDEVGRIKNWAGVLKKYYDLGKAKFIISSSSYLHVTKGKESLAGRLKDYVLPPWSLKEFLMLKGEKVEIKGESIEKAYAMFERVEEKKLIDYLKKGGFPEIADEENEREIKKYVKNSTIEKVIFEDLPKAFPVEHVDKLYDILTYIGKNSGSILNFTSLGSLLSLSKDTVKRYLFYLEKSLVVASAKIVGSEKKAMRKNKKYYPISSSITFSYQEHYNEPSLVENAVFSKLFYEFGEVKFYRNSLGREVDFVIKNLPIEVKWTTTILPEDLKNVFYFMNKYKAKEGIVVGKNFDVVEKNGKRIYILPLDFFLSLDPKFFGIKAS